MVSLPKISPNLVAGVGGLIVIALIVNQVRGAGKDLFGALPALDEGIKKSIGGIQQSIGNIKLPEFKVPMLNGGGANPLKGITDFFENILPPASAIDIDPNADLDKFIPTKRPFTGRERDRPVTGIITPEGTPLKTPTSIADFINNFIGPRRSIPDKIVSKQMTPPPEIVVNLPSEQKFLGGGVSFIGGTIRENPIDTLSEVIDFFPDLTASQARDFLQETGGKILPSQIELVDADIRNIVAAGGDIPRGTSVEVSQSPQKVLSIRESENLKAAQFTCSEFGLNCDIVKSMMA